MGCWGMGIAQSDEFCEVYEQFMEEYNNGVEVFEITQSILKQYKKEFDEDDGVLHDVYFALAKAEWMCCEQSEETLNKVLYIIENDLNIEFLRELEATEKDLKIRKKNLNKFFISLQTPRKTPRKRVAPPKYLQSAQLEKGTLFWYKKDSKIFCAILLDIIDNAHLVALSEVCKKVPKTIEDILSAPVRTTVWMGDLLPENRIHVLGKVDITETYNHRAGLYFDDRLNIHFCENGGLERDWGDHHDSYWNYPGMTLKDMLVLENIPIYFKFSQNLEQTIEQAKRIYGIKD